MNVYYLPLFLFSQTYSCRPPCVTFCVTMSWRPAVSPASSLFPCQPPETLASLHPPLPSNVFFPPLSSLSQGFLFKVRCIEHLVPIFLHQVLPCPHSKNLIYSSLVHKLPTYAYHTTHLIFISHSYPRSSSSSLTHSPLRPAGRSVDRPDLLRFLVVSFVFSPFFFSPSLISKCQVKSKSTCTENPYIQV